MMFVSLGERGIYLHALPEFFKLYHWGYIEGRFYCLQKGITLDQQQFADLRKHISKMQEFVDGKEVASVPIGDSVYLSSCEFNGKRLLHLRRYHNEKPTTTGIALLPNEATELVASINMLCGLFNIS